MEHSIYYIYDTPPVEPYYERFGMNYFNDKGWNVHAIDLSPIIHPKAYQIVTTGLIKDIEREIFYDKKSFKKYAKRIPDGAFFVFTTDFIYDIYFVYQCIRKSQYYGYMTRMDTSVEPDKAEITDRIKGMFNKDFFMHIRNSLFIRIPRKLLPIKAADFFFLGGMANRDNYISLGYTDEHTRICHIHSMDYEMYLKAKEKGGHLIEGEFCVFLDEYLPYHPDQATAGYYMDPKTYYDEMNSFLHLLQSKYGMKVVIALHPRANMEVCRKWYPDFELRKFETAELIRDCGYVVVHFSTAISYAAAFYKPLIICTTATIWERNDWRDVTGKFAELLDTAIYNVSDLGKVQLPDKLHVNRDKYREFIRLYLKADLGSEDEHLGARMYRELSSIAEG